MKNLYFVLLMVFFASVVSAQEEGKMTVEDYNKKVIELKGTYLEKNKMNGNIEAYYMIYDYMGKGFVKLDTDIIIQIKNIALLKSNAYTISFKGKDESNFTAKSDFKFEKKDIFINKEGDGIIIKKLSLEKGRYINIDLSLIGDAGESASITLPVFDTLNLSDMKTKIGKLFLLSSMNESRNKMLFRRDYVIEPNLTGIYEKSKTFGFYVEYYHLTNDALYNEGKYEIYYNIVNMVFNKSIFDQTIKKEEAKPNGVVIVPPVDLSSALPGMYKLEIKFTDLMTKEEFKKEQYFILVETVAEKNVEK